MAIQRRGVENPFDRQPEAQRFQGVSVNPASVNRSEFQVEQKTSAIDIVKGLVEFAGVPGEAYAAKLDKQVEADKIIQTQRATLGLMPTPDSTEGGYKAHMAVSVKNKTLKAQSKLNQLAEQNYSDEEWEEIVRDTYAEVDGELSSEYKDYDNYQEIQKLTTLSLAEIMPQVVSSREAAKLDHEIKKRMQDEQDVLISEIGMSGDAASILKRFEERTAAMKLTQSQKEAILTEVALNSDSETAIELTRQFKGERGSTLYERKGQLQSKHDQLKNEKYSVNAGELGLEFSTFTSDFLSGKMTAEEATRYIDKRNKETEGRFMTQAQAASMFSKARESIAARTRQQQLIQAVQSGERTTIPGAEPKEIEGAITAGWKQYLQAGITQIRKNVPEEEQAKEIAALQIRADQMWGDNSARLGVPIPEWKAAFSALANSNVAAIVGSGQIEDLPDNLKVTMDRIEQMSPSAQDFYMSSLKARERDILNNTLALREMGMTAPQALSMAQRRDRNPIPRSQRDIEEAVADVTSSIDDGIFVTDIPDYARPYYMAEVRKKIASFPDPTSEVAKRQVKAYFSNNWTTLGSGVRVKGSPQRMRQLTGLHPDALDMGFQAILEGQRDQIEPLLATYGYDFDQLIPEVDPEGGMVSFVGPAGEVLNTRPVPLTQMRTEYMRFKTAQEKRLKERNFKSLEEAGIGGF